MGLKVREILLNPNDEWYTEEVKHKSIFHYGLKDFGIFKNITKCEVVTSPTKDDYILYFVFRFL